MKITVHREIPHDETLRDQWNQLVRQMEQPEVFYTYEWATAMQLAYGATTAPLLLLAYEDKSLLGIASLAVDQSQKEAAFLASTTADYCDFVCHPGRRAEFLQLVLTELRSLRLPTVTLASLPVDSSTLPSFRPATRAQAYGTFCRPAFCCAQVSLGTGTEREAQKERTNQRKVFRYAIRRLEKYGPVVVEHLSSWNSVHSALPQYIQAHIERFAQDGRRSNLAEPRRQIFLTELARLLCRAGWMTLTTLRVGDRPVAWNYGFRFAESWFYYQPTFALEWRQFSPGLCLLSKLVEAACDDPDISLLDLGLGAEGYKQRFANASRQTVHVTLTSSAARHVKERMRYHAVSAIKSSPRLEAYVRRIMRRELVGGAGA